MAVSFQLCTRGDISTLRGQRRAPGARSAALLPSRPPSRNKRRNPPRPDARTLADRLIAELFSVPLIGDRSRIRLVVDNDRWDPSHK